MWFVFILIIPVVVLIVGKIMSDNGKGYSPI